MDRDYTRIIRPLAEHLKFEINFTPPCCRNLYFTGASTCPGTGMPTAMISGRLAAQRILDDAGLLK